MPEKLIDIAGREGVNHLRAYFTPGAYTGQWFEAFTGGGDRAETRDRITVEDPYAVEALNVQVPFTVGRELLEGQFGRDVGVHLRKIPADVELGGRGGGEWSPTTGTLIRHGGCRTIGTRRPASAG